MILALLIVQVGAIMILDVEMKGWYEPIPKNHGTLLPLAAPSDLAIMPNGGHRCRR